MDTPVPRGFAGAVNAGAARLRVRRRYRGFLRRHLVALVVLPLLAGLLAAAMTFLLLPIYEASATLVFDAVPTVEDRRVDAGVDEWSQWLQTQVLLLRSRSLAEQVAQRLDLWTRPGLDPRRVPEARAPIQLDLDGLVPAWLDPGKAQTASIPPDQARRETLDALEASLRVERVAGTRIVRIGFRSSDPRLASDVANAYAESYLEQTARGGEGTVAEIDEKLGKARHRLESAERRLREYREAHGLDPADDPADMDQAGLEALSRRLLAAKAERDGLRGELDQLDGLDTTNPAAAANHPLLSRSQVIQSLRIDEARAEETLANLSRRYGEKHPKRISAQAEVDGIRARLRAEVDTAIGAMGKAFDIAQARVDQLQKALDAQTAQARDADRRGPELNALEREVQTNRRLYDRLLGSLAKTGPQTRQVADARRILDSAQVPLSPVAPDRPLIIAAAVIVALFLVILRAVLRERHDDALLVPDALERKLGVPALGAVPVLGGKRSKCARPERAFVDDPHSLYAEAVRTIRTAIALCGEDRPHKVILVTSSLPGEGRTTVATSLALSLACTERVVLMDGDLRRSAVGARLGLPAETQGLTEVLSESEDPEDCVHRIEGTALDLIPAGVLPPDPLELLSSDRLQSVLRDLSKRYDRILIDSPPVQAVSDALILSRAAEAVLLVVKAGSTPADFAARSAERLRRADAPLLGAILNGYDAARAARRGQAPSGPGAFAYQGYSRYDSGTQAGEKAG